jgi:hypothetical protein
MHCILGDRRKCHTREERPYPLILLRDPGMRYVPICARRRRYRTRECVYYRARNMQLDMSLDVAHQDHVDTLLVRCYNSGRAFPPTMSACVLAGDGI